MRVRLLRAAALALIAGLLVMSVAYADRNDQEGEGHNLPEVPAVAALPVVAAAVGGGYYLVRRRRRGRAAQPPR